MLDRSTVDMGKYDRRMIGFYSTVHRMVRAVRWLDSFMNDKMVARLLVGWMFCAWLDGWLVK